MKLISWWKNINLLWTHFCNHLTMIKTHSDKTTKNHGNFEHINHGDYLNSKWTSIWTLRAGVAPIGDIPPQRGQHTCISITQDKAHIVGSTLYTVFPKHFLVLGKGFEGNSHFMHGEKWIYISCGIEQNCIIFTLFRFILIRNTCHLYLNQSKNCICYQIKIDLTRNRFIFNSLYLSLLS